MVPVKGDCLAGSRFPLVLLVSKLYLGMSLFTKLHLACPAPPTLANSVPADAPKGGRYLVANAHRGLKLVQRGDVKALRIVAVPAKTQPIMNTPHMGLTNDDPGKCVLGTVPVVPDGFAFLRVPSGGAMFFQALDSRGAAIQTMRGAIHVQPGLTLSCIGCHENRLMTPPARPLIEATRREPAKITQARTAPGCSVSTAWYSPCWHAWETLCNYGRPSLTENVRGPYALGLSVEGIGAAISSPLLALLTAPEKHYNVKLSPEEIERFTIWLDTYGRRLGAFSNDQEKHLEELNLETAVELRLLLLRHDSQELM